MKKILSGILALLMAFVLIGCAAPPVSEEEIPPPDVETDAPELSGEGELGDYYVKILDIALAEDYEGKPAVIVTYNWTNNGDDAANFAFAFSAQVFQGGVECETAIIMDSDVYNADNYMKDIKPGVSLDIQLAYVLQDSQTPIEVEVSELISFDDAIIVNNFDIA